MKIRSISLAALVLAGAVAGTLAAAADESATTTQAQKEACFKAHGKLMSKPTVTNADACWRAHGHMMVR